MLYEPESFIKNQTSGHNILCAVKFHMESSSSASSCFDQKLMSPSQSTFAEESKRLLQPDKKEACCYARITKPKLLTRRNSAGSALTMVEPPGSN